MDSEGQGRGTTFTVRLPTAGSAGHPPAEVVAPGASAEDTDGGGEPRSLIGLRILAVDDDPDALEVTRHILEGEGAQVLVQFRIAGCASSSIVCCRTCWCATSACRKCNGLESDSGSQAARDEPPGNRPDRLRTTG